ncbi:DUF3085 domain-containing protein [Phyllobacterium sp. P5_D12]
MKLTVTNENLKLLWADGEKCWPKSTRPNFVQHMDGDQNPPQGFWIVGDQGVYLMHNGVFPDGEKAVVAYAEECNPEKNGDWYDVKRDTFGGDDGVDLVDKETVKSALDQNGWLEFTFTPEQMMVNVVWNTDNVKIGRLS